MVSSLTLRNEAYNEMRIRMRIDFHTHVFPDNIAKRAIEKLQSAEKIPVYTEGTISSLLESSKKSGVAVNVVLPVVTRPMQAKAINNEAIARKVAFDKWVEEGEDNSKPTVYYFGGIHPDNEDYKDEIDRLCLNGVRGIKLHPVFQETYFDDIRYMRILDYAFEKGMYVNVHAGSDVSRPDVRFSFVEHIIPVLREFRSETEKIILAHFGGWNCFDLVEEMLDCYKPMVDTAFCLYERDLSVIDFKALSSDLFRRYVDILGSERVIFGTDSPWTDQRESLELLRKACISEEEFDNITCHNAKRILF